MCEVVQFEKPTFQAASVKADISNKRLDFALKFGYGKAEIIDR